MLLDSPIVTGSIVVSGSTIFGSSLIIQHQFTGSVSVTGSLSLNGSNVVLSNQTSSISVLSASYAANSDLLDGRDSLTFAGTGSNSFVGQQNIINNISANGGQEGAELLNSTGWTSTGWTGSFDTGWTHIAGNTNSLTKTFGGVITNNYVISYIVTGRTAGTFNITFGGLTVSTISATGASYGKATSTATLAIAPTSTFDGTIVISIKQITAGTANTIFTNNDETVSTEIRVHPISSTNSFYGLNSGRFSVTGATNNTAFGSQTLASLLNASSNTAFGYNALALNSTGINNTAIGSTSGQNISTGQQNTLIGGASGAAITTGNFSTYIGASAGTGTTTTNFNTAIGYQSLTNGGSGSGNTAIGALSIGGGFTGSNSIAFGYQAGRYAGSGTTGNTTSTNSMYIGYDVRASAVGNTNEVVIAAYNGTAGTIGLGSNTVSIGNSTTVTSAIYGNLLLGSTTDSGLGKLQVTGAAIASSFIPSGASVPTNGIYLSAANTLDFATNSVNRLSISSAGAATFSGLITSTIGVNNYLRASNTSTDGLFIENTNNGNTSYYGINNSTGTLFFTGTTAYSTNIGTASARDFHIGTNGIVRQTITTGGNVGIGTAMDYLRLALLIIQLVFILQFVS